MTILVAILALAGNSVARAQSAVVETTGGKIEGVQESVAGGPAVISFKGIPYEAPPAGALRWKSHSLRRYGKGFARRMHM